MQKRRQLEIIAGVFALGGGITEAGGDGWRAVRTGTGSYTVYITALGFKLVSATANTPGGSRSCSVQVFQGANIFTVGVYITNTNALDDQNVDFIAVGSQQ